MWEPIGPTAAEKRRKEWIGRGTLAVMGLLILFGGVKLASAANWAAASDAAYFQKMQEHGATVGRRAARRTRMAPMLYVAAGVVGLAGVVLTAMAVMPVSMMERVFPPKAPITHDDGTDDAAGFVNFFRYF